MKKRVCGMLFIVVLLCVLSGAARAEILPAAEYDADYYAFTGLKAQEAVVLCESLTVREAPDYRAAALYSMNEGRRFLTIVSEAADGFLSVHDETERVGWVREEYVLVRPDLLVLSASTPAYAYGSPDAPRVALLAEKETLPVISRQDGYLIVSLRGASAWIAEADVDVSVAGRDTWSPARLSVGVIEAEWSRDGERRVLRDPAKLARLTELLTDAELAGVGMAGCPFEASLRLTLADGSEAVMQLATDSCCVFRADGVDYRYACQARRASRETGLTNEILTELFW